MSLQPLRRRVPTATGQASAVECLRQSSAVPQPITAPPNDLASLAAHGDSFTFEAFTATDASNLGLYLYTRLVSEPRPALISITLANGVTVFQMATGPGVQPDNEVWVQRKRRSVLRWGCSTWSLNLKFAGDEDVFAAKFGMSRDQAGAYSIHGGGVPIRVRGVEGVVAVVVVSGLKQHEDHGVIVDVVKENWESVD